MLAVIHAESTRLEVQIKAVALTSQNVPDALQKWHETSKILEQNQTLLANKLVDIHNYIEELRNRFSMYDAKLKETKDYQKDEKFVADFGAEIAAVSADVDHIKEKFADIQKGQTDFRAEINTLKANFSEAVMNATRRANNNETSYSDELKKAQTIILKEIKTLSANVSSINDTLSQKTKMLSDDQRSQQRLIDSLQERTANITSHVDSIERYWSQNKEVLTDFDTFKNNSNYELQSLKNATIDLKHNIENVRLDCSKVRSDVLQSLSSISTKEAKTANKDMSRENDKIKAALNAGDEHAATSNASSNASVVPQPSSMIKTTPGTAIPPSAVPTSEPFSHMR